MYLISIYFDEETNRMIKKHIKQVAEKTGNSFMVEGEVPPHITISAFESRNEEAVLEAMEQCAGGLQGGTLHWVSVGTFLPHVIFLQPVLNTYLCGLGEAIYDIMSKVKDIRISPMYQPFQWLAHTTVGKTLTPEQMKTAFGVLQNTFFPFKGRAVKIGLAKTNPYTEIRTWELTTWEG